jgi:hypothetical protein
LKKNSPNMSTSPQCECDTVIPDIDFWLRRQKKCTHTKKNITQWQRIIS